MGSAERKIGGTQVNHSVIYNGLCRYAHQKQQRKMYVMYVALIVIRHALCMVICMYYRDSFYVFPQLAPFACYEAILYVFARKCL